VADELKCEPSVAVPFQSGSFDPVVRSQGYVICNFLAERIDLEVAIWPVASPPTRKRSSLDNTFRHFLKISRSCSTGWYAATVGVVAHFRGTYVQTSAASDWAYIECG
jgi:hypothetical protein